MMMRRNAVCLALCTMMLLVAQPSVAKSEKTFYSNFRLNFVKLVSLKGKEKTQVATSHPATITVDKMTELLSSIRIDHKAFMREKVQEFEVFDAEAVQVLAPAMVEAFGKASTNEVVEFSYLFKNPKVILRNDRFTTGRAWVDAGKLHVEFSKLYARIDADLSKRGYSDKAVGHARGLRVVLDTAPGQVLGASAREIVLGLDASYASAGPQVAPVTPSERLAELDRLRELDLITEPEYQAKRRAILNQL